MTWVATKNLNWIFQEFKHIPKFIASRMKFKHFFKSETIQFSKNFWFHYISIKSKRILQERVRMRWPPNPCIIHKQHAQVHAHPFSEAYELKSRCLLLQIKNIHSCAWITSFSPVSRCHPPLQITINKGLWGLLNDLKWLKWLNN